MVEAVLNKISAQLTAVHAAIKEVHAQSQVAGKTIADVKDSVAAIKSAAKTCQAGTTGVQPVTSQPTTAPQPQKAQFMAPPTKPQQVSLDQTIPAAPTVAAVPDVFLHRLLPSSMQYRPCRQSISDLSLS